MNFIFIALYLTIIALALYFFCFRPSQPKHTLASILGTLKSPHTNLRRLRFAQAFRRWAPKSDYNDSDGRLIIFAYWDFIQNNPHHTIWDNLPEDFHQALVSLDPWAFGPQSLPPKE